MRNIKGEVDLVNWRLTIRSFKNNFGLGDQD